MAEVRDARPAHERIARRASSVAAVFCRLGAGAPLPLVARELARLGVPVFPSAVSTRRPPISDRWRRGGGSGLGRTSLFRPAQPRVWS